MGGRTKKVAEKISSDLNSSEITIERFNYSKRARDVVAEREKIMKGDLSDFKFNESILDLEPYGLVFFGTPTYGGQPVVIFKGFLENAKNIEGKNFIIFNTCRFITGKTLDVLKAEIEEKGGKVINQRVFKGFFRIKLSKVKKFIDELKEKKFIS